MTYICADLVLIQMKAPFVVSFGQPLKKPKTSNLGFNSDRKWYNAAAPHSPVAPARTGRTLRFGAIFLGGAQGFTMPATRKHAREAIRDILAWLASDAVLTPSERADYQAKLDAYAKPKRQDSLPFGERVV